MSAPASSSSASSVGPGGSPVDAADERDVDNIRAALSSQDKTQTLLDLPALAKNPDKLKKACRAGIPMQQRKDTWKILLDMNTSSECTHTHTHTHTRRS